LPSVEATFVPANGRWLRKVLVGRENTVIREHTRKHGLEGSASGDGREYGQAVPVFENVFRVCVTTVSKNDLGRFPTDIEHVKQLSDAGSDFQLHDAFVTHT